MGILTGIWMALTGCRALKTQAVMDTEMAEEEETESQVWPGLLGEPGKKAEEIVSFLEQFEGGLSFRDMEKERAASYGGPLEDSYAFYGRETEDGAGYVLGIKIRKESLLDGLTVYGEDDHMEAVIQNDQDGGYDTVYVLDDISVFLAGPAQDAVLNEVLYLQPEDMETPEEILNAFDMGYCHGPGGAAYVRDMLERQVRFTPPDTGLPGGGDGTGRGALHRIRSSDTGGGAGDPGFRRTGPFGGRRQPGVLCEPGNV